MDHLRTQCIALYDLAFPGEPADFTAALFDRYFPDHVRVIEQDGTVASMLFSIPYPILFENGMQNAHYLYAIATHPDHRGKGLAKQLIAAEAARGPVFLRPMTESLFDFYAKAGLSPISPLLLETGFATAPDGNERLLTKAEYLAARDALSPRPTCRPTEDLLALYELGGGFAAIGDGVAALFERHGDRILYKEYWGDPVFAPRLTAFLGGKRFELRRSAPGGKPFGMAHGVPAEAAFLAAMD